MDVQEEQYISRFGRACTECGLVRYWSNFARSTVNATGFDDTCTECRHNQVQQTVHMNRPNPWYAQKGAKA